MKKKLLVLVERSSDADEARSEREHGRFPGPVAGNRLWFPPHTVNPAEAGFARILPRVFEWSIVPGPDETQ